jgi:hypothetical protein
MRADPSARRVVERIFAEETGEPANAGDPTARVRGAYEKLAHATSPVIGDAGLRAMLARSVRQSQARYPFLDAVAAVDLGAFQNQLWTSLRQQEPLVIEEIGIAVLTNFVETLSTLIGEELTLKVFRNAWPEANAFDPDEPEKP